MSVLGVLICGVSVGMFKHAALGVDPFQSLLSGLNAVFPISFGTLYVIANVVLLIIALVFDRRKIGLATLINLFFLGYIAEWSQKLFQSLLPAPGWTERILLLLTAIVIMCLASAIYYTADLGVSTYDSVALILSERVRRIPFRYLRISSDFLCVSIGVILFLTAGWDIRQIQIAVGVGTIITAFFMGPLIEFFQAHIAQPLLEH